jgi:hypothetical protein
MRVLAKASWVFFCVFCALGPASAQSFDGAPENTLTKKQLIEIVEFAFPNSYAKYSPQWRRLRQSCAEAGTIVREHADLERRIATAQGGASGTSQMRLLLLTPKDALTRSQFMSLAAVKTLQLRSLDELFVWVESMFKNWMDGSVPEVRSWAQSLLDVVRADRTALNAALEQSDFSTCVRVMDEYLPPESGRSS